VEQTFKIGFLYVSKIYFNVYSIILDDTLKGKPFPSYEHSFIVGKGMFLYIYEINVNEVPPERCPIIQIF